MGAQEEAEALAHDCDMLHQFATTDSVTVSTRSGGVETVFARSACLATAEKCRAGNENHACLARASGEHDSPMAPSLSTSGTAQLAGLPAQLIMQVLKHVALRFQKIIVCCPQLGGGPKDGPWHPADDCQAVQGLRGF